MVGNMKIVNEQGYPSDNIIVILIIGGQIYWIDNITLLQIILYKNSWRNKDIRMIDGSLSKMHPIHLLYS